MSLRDRRIGGARKLPAIVMTVTVVCGLIALAYVNRERGEQAQNGVEAEPIFVPGPATFAPGLHLLGALSPSVAYVVESSEGLILIDTGLEDAHAILLRQLEMLSLDVRDLKVILITHGHGDHYLGAMQLKRLTGAKIYAGQGDASVLREAGPREAVFSTFPMDHVQIHPTDVDVELVGGETIELGDIRIQALATPGHTPGSMCYLLERNGRTALFSGDTIMTISGDLGTYATYLAPRYRGNAADYLASLRKLEKLPAPDLLLPGHPHTNLRMVSARLTPQEWSALLGQGIQQMEALTQRYEADGADFLDGNPKKLLPELHYLGDFSGSAVYCFTSRSSLVLIDAPGGPGLVKFLEERLGGAGLDLAMLKAVVLTGTDPQAIGGLAALVERTGCRIIAAQSVQQEIRSLTPKATVLPPEDAAQEIEWLPLRAIPIEGFARTRTAYVIPWKGKQVLVSGLIPLKASGEEAAALARMLVEPAKFMQSLDRLRRLAPDLWLPARPVHGQNANLYGSEWQDLFR